MQVDSGKMSLMAANEQELWIKWFLFNASFQSDLGDSVLSHSTYLHYI